MREEFRLFRYLKRVTPLVVLLCLSIVVYSATMYSISWMYKVGYDEYLPSGNGAVLVKILVFIIGTCAGRIISYYLVQRIALSIRCRVRHAMRSDLLKHLLETRYALYQQYSFGTIVNRLIPETDMAAEAIVKTCEAAVYLFQIITFFVFLIFLDGILGLSYIGLFSIILFFMVILRRRVETCQQALSKTRDRFFTFFYSYFTSTKEIKCYNLFPFQKEILRDIMEEDGRRNLSLARTKSVLDLSTTIPISLGAGILYVWGFYQLLSGGYTYGFLLTMLSLLGALYLPMMEFSSAVSIVQSGLASLGKVDRFFGSTLESQEGASVPPIEKSITLDHLFFSYNPDTMILNDIHVDFPSNTFIAIVGESGSGKTTLVNLLLRLFDVPDGRIHVDGQDINSVGTNSLREQIGIVSQESFFLNASLKENIDVNGRLSDGEVLDLCRDAGLSDLVKKLPRGLHAQLSEDAKNLSGGEKQRVAVARCLAKKVKVIILDEATSALDFGTEQKIIHTLLDLKKKRRPFMIISITHRPSFARYADHICVMEKGALTESGTHAELMSRKRTYFTLFSKSEQ